MVVGGRMCVHVGGSGGGVVRLVYHGCVKLILESLGKNS